jgi:hypothetical protein
MADENQLEKTVKEEEKNLEKKKEKGLFRKAFDLAWAGAYAVGATALSTAAVGPLGMMIGGALGAGTFLGSLARGKDSFYETVRKSIKNYGIVNTVITPMVKLGDLTYPIVGKIGAGIAGGIGSVVAKSTYALTGYNFAFNTLFKGTEHLIDNYMNPKGMVKSIKKDFKETNARVGKVFAPGYLLAANGIPAIAGIPSFALNALPAGFINNYNPVGEKKAEPKANYQPQTAGATA